MAKNSRKKQKTAAEGRDAIPLGAQFAVDIDAEKDDEERRLESLLFGKTFTPRDSSSAQQNELMIDVDDDEGGGNALQQLQDNDVRLRVTFFFFGANSG